MISYMCDVCSVYSSYSSTLSQPLNLPSHIMNIPSQGRGIGLCLIFTADHPALYNQDTLSF